MARRLASPPTPLAARGERGRTGIGHFLQKNGQNLWQVFPDRSSGDGSQNGFSGLSASADVTGEQDGVGEDLLSQVRTLQDSAPSLLGCIELTFELLDPLIPLSKGLLEGRHLSTVYFVPVFGPGEEIGDGVGHLQDYGLAVEVDNTNAEGGAAAQILDSRVAGGSSPCFISTSITGVVDPDPSRRVRFAGATSSTSTSFSFSFPCLAARVSPWPPLGSEACVAVKGSPAGTRASALGASVLGSADLADPAFLDPRLIFFAGAGGRAETGKLLMAPENQKTGKPEAIPSCNGEHLASLRLRGARTTARCRLKEGMEHRLPVANTFSIRLPRRHQSPPSAEGRDKQQWHCLKEEAATAGVSAALRMGDSNGEPEIHPTSTISHCRGTTTTVEHLSAVSLSSQQRAEIACSGLGMATKAPTTGSGGRLRRPAVRRSGCGDAPSRDCRPPAAVQRCGGAASSSAGVLRCCGSPGVLRGCSSAGDPFSTLTT
nr:hypothetical protein Itr_chr09CG17040 [Ipomoea trifida]